MDNKDSTHLPQFYPPSFILKKRVGQGGLSKSTIIKAQSVIDLHKIDFEEVISPYMVVFTEGLGKAKKTQHLQSENHDNMIEEIIFPAMQMKANGELFHYPLITRIAERLLFFLERIHKLNTHAIDIVNAFEGAIKLVFAKNLKGDITEDGETIVKELDAVCKRFFEKYPENIHPRFLE